MNPYILSTQRKVRVSEKLYKSLPKAVAEQVRSYLEQFDFSKHGGKKVTKLNLVKVSCLYSFNVAEGARTLGIGPNGEQASFEAVAEHNIGAANVTHRIGAEYHMPPGSYVLTVETFLGDYYAELYSVEPDEDAHLPQLVQRMNADAGMVVTLGD